MAFEEALSIIEHKEPDWEWLYSLADQHAIKPQLAKLLGKIAGPAVPLSVRERFESSYRQNLTDQINHVTEFMEVRNRLEDGRIAVVPFKGFWLAERFYGNLADREASDIDVFVNYSDLGKIMKLMPGTGYLIGEPFINQPDPGGCEFNYGKYIGGRCVSHLEFHWRMAPARFGLDISLDDLKGSIESSSIQGHELRVFNPSASLLLTVMHHGGKDSFRLLKQVYDVAMIIRSGRVIDYIWLEQKAREFHCRRLLLISLKLAALMTGMKVPDAVVQDTESRKIAMLARNRMRALGQLPSDRRRFMPELNDWIFRIRSREGVRVKTDLVIRFVRKALMPRLVPKSMHRFFMRKYVVPEYAR